MKYNKYNIGDTVGNKENDSTDFEVMNVLPDEPEKQGEYWYVCKLIRDKRKPIPAPIGIKYNYKEDKLFLIKKASRNN